jgi:hypothetical protein
MTIKKDVVWVQTWEDVKGVQNDWRKDRHADASIIRNK